MKDKENRKKKGKSMGWSQGIVLVMVLAALAGCQKEPSYSSSTTASSSAPSLSAAPAAGTPAEFAKGEALFNSHCAACHGQKAMGTKHGPPFIDMIYVPNHHADATFHLAVRNGVRAHHWPYGNMLPVEGVSEPDVNEIIGYVRWLQRQAGIS
jgi:mono/diheme cytochrome c family protein